MERHGIYAGKVQRQIRRQMERDGLPTDQLPPLKPPKGKHIHRNYDRAKEFREYFERGGVIEIIPNLSILHRFNDSTYEPKEGD